MHVFYIFLISAFFIFPAPANAVEPLPEILTGYWAAPDCKSPDVTTYHGQTHILYFNEDTARLTQAHLNKTNFDYFVVQNGDDVYPVQVYNDGIMSVGMIAKNHKLDDRLNWDQLPLDGIRQYMKCAEAPGIPHDIAPRAMQTLDTLEYYCRYGTEEGCLKEVIKTLDEDGNLKLNYEEAVKASLLAMYISPFLNYKSIEHDYIMQRMKTSYNESTLYMTDIFKLIDADISGQISYDELDHATTIALPQLQEKRPHDAFARIMSVYPKLQSPNLYR